MPLKPLDSLPKFRLEKDYLSNTRFIKYNLNFEDQSREPGHFILILEQLSSLSPANYPNSKDCYKLRPHLLNHGLTDSSKIAFLAGFYPNGPEPKPEQTRQGLGGRMFNFCLYLAITNGAKAMHGTSLSEQMDRIFSKNGFARFPEHQGLHYKLL